MGRRQTDKPDFRSSDGHSGRSIGKNRKRGYTDKCRMTCPAGKESRNAGFILIAAQRQSTPSKPSKPFEPYEPAEPFSLTTLLHNLRRQPRPLFIKLAAKPPPQPSGRSPVNPHTAGVSKGEEISSPRAWAGRVPPAHLPGNRCPVYRCIRWHRRGRKPLSSLPPPGSFPKGASPSPRW